MKEEIAKLDGAIKENQIMLDYFKDRLKGLPTPKIITQPMTYFKTRIEELEAEKKNLEGKT